MLTSPAGASTPGFRTGFVLRLVAGCFVFALLFTNLRWNWTGSSRPGQFEGFQSDSDGLVFRSVLTRLSEGVWHHGGFMTVVEQSHSSAKYGLPEIANTPADRAYLSQFALQYQVWSLVGLTNIEQLSDIIRWFWLIASAAFALLLTAFLADVARRFGALSAAITFGLIMISDWIILFGRSPYWVIFTHFLPFVATWVSYDKLSRSRRGWIWLLSMVATLVCIKALCGYEYLSNIVLACTVPVVFHEWQQRRPLVGMMKRSAAIVLAGALGFSFAVGAHFVQASAYLDSTSLAWKSIAGRARARTVGQSVVAAEVLPENVGLKEILDLYVDREALGIRQNGETWFSLTILELFLIALFLLLLGALMTRRGTLAGPSRTTLQGLLLATCWSGMASISWTVLARAHTFDHKHMNAVTFYLPFFLMVYVLLGYELVLISQALATRRQARLSGNPSLGA